MGTESNNGRLDEQVLNGEQLVRLVENRLLTDRMLLSMFGDRRRNIESECGYKQTAEITAKDYQDIFDREPVAARVVNVFPMECWQLSPQLIEDEDIDNVTEFEQAWTNLGKNLLSSGMQGYFKDERVNPLWSYLERADIWSGIGSYGAILLGIDDGKELSEPAQFITKTGAANKKLNFLRVLSEVECQVTQFDNERSSVRYGKPEMYNVVFGTPSFNQTKPYIGSAVGANQMATRSVHWSRIIHVVDNPYGTEVGGIPRMQQVYNRLYDLHKLYGGSAEMYWQGAFPGISFETHPSLGGDVKLDEPTRRAMKEQLVNYTQGLQRWLTMAGMSAKTLAPQVVDPTSHIEAEIQAICILLGVPKRVFMGSERGELSSNQDIRAWYGRCKHRQDSYITPFLIVQFIDRLINLGVLPVPKQGYSIQWPDLASATDLEKAQIAVQRMQALSSYMMGQLYQLITPRDALARIVGFDESEANQMIEDTQENMDQMQEAHLEQSTQPPEPSQGGDQQQGGDKKEVKNTWSDAARKASALARHVAYHGTDNYFTEFDDTKLGSRTDPGFFGMGHYFVSDKANAARWGKHVVEAEVHLKNPLVVSGITEFVTKAGQRKTNSKDEYAAEMRRVTEYLKSQGYDGVIVNRSDGTTQYVVFSGDDVTIKNSEPSVVIQNHWDVEFMSDSLVNNTIVKTTAGYMVVSESKGANGKRKNLGGPYANRQKAEKRLQEVEYFKHVGNASGNFGHKGRPGQVGGSSKRDSEEEEEEESEHEYQQTLEGEYWLDSGMSLFADGDIGDMNHEGYAIDQAQRMVIDSLGDDYDEFSNDIAVDWEGMRDKLEETFTKNDANGQEGEITDKRLESLGVDPRLWRVAEGIGDVRAYAAEHWGWIRLAGNSVQMKDLSQLKDLGNGIDDAFPDENIDLDNQSFDIETKGGYYTDVPYLVIKDGKAADLYQYKQHGTPGWGGVQNMEVDNAWSDNARIAALEARRHKGEFANKFEEQYFKHANEADIASQAANQETNLFKAAAAHKEAMTKHRNASNSATSVSFDALKMHTEIAAHHKAKWVELTEKMTQADSDKSEASRNLGEERARLKSEALRARSDVSKASKLSTSYPATLGDIDTKIRIATQVAERYTKAAEVLSAYAKVADKGPAKTATRDAATYERMAKIHRDRIKEWQESLKQIGVEHGEQ